MGSCLSSTKKSDGQNSRTQGVQTQSRPAPAKSNRTPGGGQAGVSGKGRTLGGAESAENKDPRAAAAEAAQAREQAKKQGGKLAQKLHEEQRTNRSTLLTQKEKTPDQLVYD